MNTVFWCFRFSVKIGYKSSFTVLCDCNLVLFAAERTNVDVFVEIRDILLSRSRRHY